VADRMNLIFGRGIFCVRSGDISYNGQQRLRYLLSRLQPSAFRN